MAETIVLAISYERADTIKTQGTRSKIDKHLRDGYFIKVENNGYWVLGKSAQVNVTLKSGKIKGTFNMKSDVCEYYGKERISASLVEKFKKDVEAGKIELTISSDGYTFN